MQRKQYNIVCDMLAELAAKGIIEIKKNKQFIEVVNKHLENANPNYNEVIFWNSFADDFEKYDKQ